MKDHQVASGAVIVISFGIRNSWIPISHNTVTVREIQTAKFLDLHRGRVLTYQKSESTNIRRDPRHQLLLLPKRCGQLPIFEKLFFWKTVSPKIVFSKNCFCEKLFFEKLFSSIVTNLEKKIEPKICFLPKIVFWKIVFVKFCFLNNCFCENCFWKINFLSTSFW